MSTARSIVIVGAGPAGVGAALAARQQDPAAEILLLTDELCEPYEKAAAVEGGADRKGLAHEAPIAGPGGVGGHRITLKLSTRCAAIDRSGRAR